MRLFGFLKSREIGDDEIDETLEQAEAHVQGTVELLALATQDLANVQLKSHRNESIERASLWSLLVSLLLLMALLLFSLWFFRHADAPLVFHQRIEDSQVVGSLVGGRGSSSIGDLYDFLRDARGARRVR